MFSQPGLVLYLVFNVTLPQAWEYLWDKGSSFVSASNLLAAEFPFLPATELHSLAVGREVKPNVSLSHGVLQSPWVLHPCWRQRVAVVVSRYLEGNTENPSRGDG